MQYPMIYAVFHVGIIVIATDVVMLSWWKVGKRRSQKIDDLPVLATC